MGGGASAADDDDMDVTKWNILYPNYINSKKTQQEGRRIGVAKCVEHPHAAEMAEICEFLKIPHALEMDKAYPRDWLVRGRIRILLKTSQGAFTHPEIHTKMALMLKMGELIPKLKTRVGGAPAGASGGAAGSSSNKTAKKEEKKEAKKADKKAQKAG